MSTDRRGSPMMNDMMDWMMSGMGDEHLVDEVKLNESVPA